MKKQEEHATQDEQKKLSTLLELLSTRQLKMQLVMRKVQPTDDFKMTTQTQNEMNLNNDCD